MHVTQLHHGLEEHHLALVSAHHKNRVHPGSGVGGALEHRGHDGGVNIHIVHPHARSHHTHVGQTVGETFFGDGHVGRVEYLRVEPFSTHIGVGSQLDFRLDGFRLQPKVHVKVGGGVHAEGGVAQGLPVDAQKGERGKGGVGAGEQDVEIVVGREAAITVGVGFASVGGRVLHGVSSGQGGQVDADHVKADRRRSTAPIVVVEYDVCGEITLQWLCWCTKKKISECFVGWRHPTGWQPPVTLCRSHTPPEGGIKKRTPL